MFNNVILDFEYKYKYYINYNKRFDILIRLIYIYIDIIYINIVYFIIISDIFTLFDTEFLVLYIRRRVIVKKYNLLLIFVYKKN